MGSRELYFYVWALYGRIENLKYVTLRLHQNECVAAEVFVQLEKQMKKNYTKFERTIVTHIEGMRVGILFYHCKMYLVMVVYELMFQQVDHRYLKYDYDLFHVPKLFAVLK
jgi:hypothetical protein